MNRDYKYIGKRLPRPDARDKALGRTRYVADMTRHGMLYGKLVTSQKAHARVMIDKSEALLVEGVWAVFTHEDVPQKPYNSNQWYSGSVIKADEYILHDLAKHVGDRVALVLGNTLEAAERGCQALKITYEVLPPTIGIGAARAAVLSGENPELLCFEKTLSCGDVESGFAASDFIIEDFGSTQKVHHAAIENHVCLAEQDPFDNLVIWTPCQVVFQVQHVTAQALGLPYDKIRVIKADMGGSFGGKGMPVLEPICAFAALKTGRPVRIVMDRMASIASTRMRNASEQRIRTGITKDGKILAREIEIDFDGGAYITNGAAIAVAAGKKAFRSYDIENQRYTGRTFFTNTTPGGACRGYGSPQVHAVSEINLTNAARKIGMDPVDFRILNSVLPQETAEGAVDQLGMPGIGNARLRDCLTEGKRLFKWDERKAAVANKKTARYAYGLGVAVGAHGNGYHGGFPDYTNITIQIMPDDRILIKIGIHDLGCGTVLTMQQIAAEVLDVPTDKIQIPQADTHQSPYDSAGTQASRVTFVCGGAVKAAAEGIKAKMATLYAGAYGCEPDEVRLNEGMIGCVSSVSSEASEEMSFGRFAVYCESKLETTLKVDLEYKSVANPAVYSVAFVEAKVDRYLGLVDVEDILVVQDAGQVINRTLAEGQVQGGAQMSLGMALCEEVIFDAEGNLKTDNFSKYHMINTTSMPEVRIHFIEKGEPLGPFGAKSVGELAAVAPAPALINAINDALGTTLTDYPATPERIIAATQRLNS